MDINRGWMQMHADEARINTHSERVIDCAFQVFNTLGSGFLEKISENALVHELRKPGFSLVQQQGITVQYDGIIVGECTGDLMVEGKVIVELKAIKAFDDVHTAQASNYLK